MRLPDTSGPMMMGIVAGSESSLPGSVVAMDRGSEPRSDLGEAVGDLVSSSLSSMARDGRWRMREEVVPEKWFQH